MAIVTKNYTQIYINYHFIIFTISGLKVKNHIHVSLMSISVRLLKK